jgi:hypothetical protein
MKKTAFLICLKIAIGLSLVSFSLLGDDNSLPVIAFWQFSDDAPYADSSGNGNDITVRNRDILIKNNFAHFPLDTKGSVGSQLNFKDYNALTIEFFIRYNDFAKENMILYTYYGWNGDPGFFGLYAGGDKSYVKDVLTSIWVKKVESSKNVIEEDKILNSPLADNGWHHVAVVIDASSEDPNVVDEMKVYVDGELCTSSKPSTHHHAAMFPKTTHFILGYIAGGNGLHFISSYAQRAQYFTGDMDDVRITGAALEPSQFLKAPTIAETSLTDGYVRWVGTENGEWNNAANWSTGEVPSSGSKVLIPPTACVTLDKEIPTAELDDIKIDGTLVFASSNNCLRADNVYISASGRVQSYAPFFNGVNENGAKVFAVSNRVWIVCENLTVAEGGLITVKGRGFAGARTSNTTGQGPGSTSDGQDYGSGAGSHGGYSTSSVRGLPPYGDNVYPETAGSGGTQWTADIAGGDAGGVVRIDASGCVTVNGSIDANAQDLIEYQKYGRSCAGSGGSILIMCSTITGSGKILARGGHSSGNEAANPAQSWPGAGGRIAVHYDSNLQTAEAFKNLFFDVRPGLLRSFNSYSFKETGFRLAASAGTLYFTDSNVITSENISQLCGRLVNAPNLTFDGDLVISNWVGFATDGVKVKVNGNLTLSGADARLEFGSVTQTVASVQRKNFVSETPSSLEVTGNFVVTNSARFDIYCASTNDLHKNGFVANINGSFILSTNTYVYPISHPLNGGSAKFNVNDLVVLEGASFGIVGGGFTGGNSQNGYGPGLGSTSIGAGHGGRGGYSIEAQSAKYGQVYGDLLRPTLPGSGGAISWSGGKGAGAGGGVLHVCASNSIYIAGSLIADGTEPIGYDKGATAGSGGSILLETLSCTLADTAYLSAKGGATCATPQKNNNKTSAGGGGRIAIWTSTKFFYTDDIEKDRIVSSSTIPEVWAGRFDVSGGEARLSENAYPGGDGTVMFVELLSPRGFTVLIR